MQMRVERAVAPRSRPGVLWLAGSARVRWWCVLVFAAVCVLLWCASVSCPSFLLPEPLGGAHRDYEKAASTIKSAIKESLKSLKRKPIEKLLDERYARYRKLGMFEDREAANA